MHEISKNTIGAVPNFKIRKLVICVTSSYFPPPGKTRPFRAKYALLVSFPHVIFMKGYTSYALYLATCFPNVHGVK